MTISAGGVTGDGRILMDTGVDAAFLTPPAGANFGALEECPGTTLVECVPDGKVITVFLPNDISPVASYKYTVGDSSNHMAPDGTHVDSGTDVFFNTSRHVLGGINFLYDNSNGYIGYIWNGNSDASIGFVTPATNSSITTITSSNNCQKRRVPVTYTATVTGIGSSVVPTGGVTFVVDNVQTYVPLNGNGIATFTTTYHTRCTHDIVAKYSGDLTYVRSVSAKLSQDVH